jgi:tetratricopeptide (TPR) repeat protein
VKGGDYQGALNDYRKGLEINPKDPSIHNNLAWLYATAKGEKFQDKLKALEHAAKAVELSSERNVEILDTLARVYFINGKIDEAIETEKKALKLEPNNERFKENLKEYEKAMKKD